MYGASSMSINQHTCGVSGVETCYVKWVDREIPQKRVPQGHNQETSRLSSFTVLYDRLKRDRISTCPRKFLQLRRQKIQEIQPSSILLWQRLNGRARFCDETLKNVHGWTFDFKWPRGPKNRDVLKTGFVRNLPWDFSYTEGFIVSSVNPRV